MYVIIRHCCGFCRRDRILWPLPEKFAVNTVHCDSSEAIDHFVFSLGMLQSVGVHLVQHSCLRTTLYIVLFLFSFYAFLLLRNCRWCTYRCVAAGWGTEPCFVGCFNVLSVALTCIRGIPDGETKAEVSPLLYWDLISSN